jgi:hypothetical protein
LDFGLHVVGLQVQVLRARHDQEHPEQAAIRERTRHTRRLAAEWPLLAQTLGLGYRDQWTRQHRYPAAEFVADDQGVTVSVAAIAGLGWPTTSAPLLTWPTPGAVSASAPSNKDRA